MPLSDIVRVTISIESAAVVAAGFGVPAIFGDTQDAFGGAMYREYSDPAEMLEDGFAITDPEYVDAVALMAQSLKPDLFVVVRRAVAVAQVDTITPSTVTNSATYTFTINGRTVTYTADGATTATEISDGLRAALAALSPAEPVTGTGTTTVIITANEAGVPFTVAESDAKLTLVHTTASTGIEDDLAAARAAGANWYATLLTSRSADVIYRAATWVEGNSGTIPLILIAQTNDAAVRDTVYGSAETDLGSRLKAANFTRTALLWHALDAEYLDAAFAGRMLPEDPGTETWALKELSGVTVDTHTTTQKNILQGSAPLAGKNVNLFYALTSANSITSRGTMSSGDWIDLIRFADFLKARISEGIASLMLAAKKIPFTDDGLQLLANQVRAPLHTAQNTTPPKLDSYKVTVPRSADISVANKSARILDPPITFSAVYAGAVHDAGVTGTITQ